MHEKSLLYSINVHTYEMPIKIIEINQLLNICKFNEIIKHVGNFRNDTSYITLNFYSTPTAWSHELYECT